VGSSIDNRIVSMRFDNAQFEKGAKDTIGTLDQLNKSLKFDGAKTGLNDLSKSIQKVDVSHVSAGIKDINWSLVAVTTMAQTVFRNITNYAQNAGINIAKSLSTEGITSGFKEYEMKMGAIQTMMASTGESLETVNKYLQELNAYSDQTIYSFSDMTNNIGKFTNAGVKLPAAVAAIKGIANAAALAGVPAENAASAMYNLGQAMGKGYVADIDWRSIEFANMATMEMKQQLLDQAVAQGTVEKTAEGMYRAIGKNGAGSSMKNAVSASAMLADNLQYQWLTADVLTATLNNYADITTDVGRRATAAATNIKTFSQMISVVKEAISSDWAMTWEYIFGDLEEAKVLWTNVALAIGSVIGPLGETRNRMLKFWNDNGGREAVIQGFTNVFKALGAVLGPIGKGFKKLFPPATGEGLVKVSKLFEFLTSKLIPTEGLLKILTALWSGLFALFSLGAKGVTYLYNELTLFVRKIAEAIGPLDEIKAAIGEAVTYVSDFFIGLNNAVSEAKPIETALNYLESVFTGISAGAKEFVGGFGLAADITKKATKGMTVEFVKMAGTGKKLKGFFSAIGDQVKLAQARLSSGLDNIGTAMSSMVKNIDWNKVLDTIFAGLTGGALYVIIKNIVEFIKTIKTMKNLAIEYIQKTLGIMEGFTKVLKGMQNNLNANAIRNIAIAIGILVLSMVGLSLIDPGRLWDSVKAVSLLLGEVSALMITMSKFGGKIDGFIAGSAGLILLAIAVNILATAVKKIGEMDPEVIAQGLFAISIMLYALAGAAAMIKDPGTGMIGAGIAILAYATAVKSLAKTVAMLGEIDSDKLWKGLLAVGVVFAYLVTMTKVVKASELQNLGINMLMLSIGIWILSEAIGRLGAMDVESLNKGILALGAVMVLMASSLAIVPDDAATKALGLLIVAASLVILTAALYLLSTISSDNLTKGMVAIAAALAIIAAFMFVAAKPDMLAGAAALAIVAISLIGLAYALDMMGKMSWEAIGKSMVALAGALLLIIAAGALALYSGSIVGVLGLGIALLLLCEGLLFAGAGVWLFATGIQILGTALEMGGKKILDFIMAFASILPMLAFQMAKAVGSFAIGLMQEQAAITQALISLFSVVLDSLTKTMPKIMNFLSVAISAILKLLVEKIPEIVIAIMKLLFAIYTALEAFMPILVEKAGDLVVAFINALGDYYVKIGEAGANFIIKIIVVLY
jgi:hypothetical protein